MSTLAEDNISGSFDKTDMPKPKKFLGEREDNQELRKLCRAPALAWPTMTLFIISSVLYLCIVYLAVTQSIPLPYWIAGFTLGVLAYLQFSVAHDASHRAISTNKRINEWTGGMALLFLAPFAPLAVIRRIHMQHHIYANGDLDPDHWVHHGSPWTAPLRWATLEIYYLYYYLRFQQPRPLSELLTTAVSLVIVLAVISGLVFLGYGKEVLWLWFIPTRVGVFFVSAVFVFLPHYPHEVAQNEDPYRATIIRRGWEWLLTPIMAYQNYHLMHHLYPTAPFYNNIKLWESKLEDPEFMKNNPAIVSAFQLKPRN